MLKRILHSNVFAVACGTMVGIALLWLVSFALGLSYEICDQGGEQNCSHYTSHSLVYVLGWHLIDISNWLSPAITAFATIAIALFTIVLTGVGRRADTHFQIVERAYVKLSHNRPGMVWNPNVDGQFSVVFQMKNFGRTPASVVAFSLGGDAITNEKSLPPSPNYNRAVSGGAFLVADDSVFHTSTFSVTPAEKAQIMAQTARFALFGYVEYIDRFGHKHRGGYGRWYDRVRDVKAPWVSDKDFAERTNLTFIEEPGYNYDIELPG